MKIDAVLCTYDRAGLLAHAIESALTAAASSSSDVHVIVVDNNSTDNTRQVAERYVSSSGGKLTYLFEREQGKHHALNRGIAHSTAEIVAFFDDDETLDSNWFNVIADCFADSAVDYVGGPYHPNWSMAPPAWLPKKYNGAIGIIQNGPERRRYDSDGFNAMPVGGNLAIRRTTLDRCGPYSSNYMYSEDRYMHEQLISIGAVGYYIPELSIHHHIPKHRLQKSYYRTWAATEGRNRGRMDKERRQNKTVLLGAPPWMWRELVDSSLTWLTARLGRGGDTSEAFTAELNVRQFVNFYAARNLPFIKERYRKRI